MIGTDVGCGLCNHHRWIVEQAREINSGIAIYVCKVDLKKLMSTAAVRVAEAQVQAPWRCLRHQPSPETVIELRMAKVLHDKAEYCIGYQRNSLVMQFTTILSDHYCVNS